MKVRTTGALLAALLMACLGLAAAGQKESPLAQAAERPNAILVLTDDLDAQVLEDHPTDYPNLRRLAAEGTSFENAFVTDSLCCPSRATILRGQYAHNHQVLTNASPLGGAGRFRDLGRQNSTIATWLQSGGYRTALLGKYFNGYNTTTVPPGWDEWHAFVSDQTKINNNGVIGPYEGYETDALAEEAVGFVERATGDAQPFFMYLAPRNPHSTSDPAPRHQDLFLDAKAPRPPSFNEADVSDKPAWLRSRPPLSSGTISSIDALYRERLQQLKAVDEMLGRLVASLEGTGELESTYIFFSSDHGFMQGEHRLWNQKWRAYEETIRVPLVVRGPGVPAGQTLDHMVLNNDFAPTFAALTGASPPDFVDGRSFGPLLTATPPSQASWRSAFLEEGRHGSSEEEYEAVRTKEHLYVEYKTGEHELYDLRTDPYQLNNQYATADPTLVSQLHTRLEALRGCTTEACRSAEDSATDTVAPTVVNTTPPDGAAGTAVSAGVTAIFSEAMDASTIDGSTFTLSAQGSGSPVSSSVSYDPAGMKATLRPDSALQANTTYVARVTTGAKDLSGNALAPEKRWSFTTASGACTVTGTSAAETLTGTSGDDVICGGDGNDTIKGEGGNDTIKGEGGADKLFGGEGADTMDGGLGTDTASYNASTTPITASLSTNTATGQGADAFLSVESLIGGSKADSLAGSAAYNRLAGGGGTDTVVGNGGADLLYGEAGNDSVDSRDGVSGNDSLDGGTGTDTKTTDTTEKSVIGFP